MLGIVKEISGQKQIIPLTTDAGTGAPVGTLIQQYKKKPMSGYLYCDGSTFDQNAYPALYMYLGTNVLPDYRECVMVGAEQNTTDTIETHDVYGEGEFKDDQLQDHNHDVSGVGYGESSGKNWVYKTRPPEDNSYASDGTVNTSAPTGARTGETTHGKQKAVYVYIKATSGLAENQQDNVLNDVKDYVDNSNSYSTQEVKTGGTWIAGKPIYRKTFIYEGVTTANAPISIGSISNVEDVETIKGTLRLHAGGFISLGYMNNDNNKVFEVNTKETGEVIVISPYNSSNSKIIITVEYTKTTD